MTDTYTFKTCDGVTGVPNAFVPHMQGTSISFEMSEVGSIGFDYYKAGVNASFLQANRVEIAVFQNGVEMDDGRFVIQSDSDDELENDGVVKYTGVSLLNMLKGAIVYSADGSVTLGVDQTFITSTAGGILKALFDQNAARGTDRVMDRITYSSFSPTLDSAGNAWAFTLGSITYTVGVSYLDVIRNLVANGMIEVKMVGRDLRVYNAGGLGTDKTIVAEPIVLRKGRDLMEAPRTRTKEQIAAVALVVGDANVLSQFVDSSVGAAWGFDETFISQGGISDPTTLGILSQQEIERRSQIRIENTHKVALNNSPWKPYVDYRVSDYVYTDRGNGPERLRIVQMVLDIEDGGVSSASLVLNDKFLEHDIAIARRVDGILGGASSTGSVAIPAEPDPGFDTTTPNAPASLSTTSSVYVTEAGRSVTAAALSWPAVTQNTDTSVISDLDHYETEWKADAATNVVAPSAFGPAREDTDLTHKFDRRFQPYGWIGADGGASVRTSSGKDWWFFADSFIGTAFGSGKIGTGPQSFIHNSIVITDPVVPATFDSRYGMGNKLSANDAFLETTVGLWQADTNCSVARDTTAFWYGAASLKITATAAGDATARIAAPTTSNYAVTAGKTYSVMAKVKTLSGTARNVQIGIRWYNSSNALIGTSISVSIGGLTTGWARYNLADVAPVGAVKAAMIITIKAAAAAQVFNCDTMGLMENDQIMASWNDPNRGAGGNPVALINPEDLGGAAIATGSLANAMFWVDNIIEVSGKVYGFMTRYSPVGAFQSSIAIAQWDGTTGAFEGLFSFTTSDVIQWGNALWNSGGFLYIYGLDSTSPSSAQTTWLMRVPIGNIVGGTKEYLSNASTGTFSTTRASAVLLYTGFAHHFGNIDFRGGVYNTIVTLYGGGTLRRLTASQLWGPWTDTGAIYTQPNVGSGLVAYFPRRHPQFDSNGGVSMSYSVNGSVGGLSVTDNIRWYEPKFVRGPVSVQAALTPLTAWSAPRMIEPGVLTDNIGDIPSGWNFMARVRAVDSSGNESAWRDGIPIRTVDDTSPPNKPSAPIMSPQFKGIRVEWNGLDYQAGPTPADWDHMEVHVSTIANFTPGIETLIDIFKTPLGGVSSVQDLIYGQTYYGRLVSVDVRGNASTPSDVGSVTPQQLVNTAELGAKLIAGANIADNAIAVRSITVAAFEPSIVPNGGFEDDALNADGSTTNLPSFWAPTPWTIGGGATVDVDSTTPIAGNKSLRMTMATAADGLRYGSAKFPVAEGRLLAVSVKVKASRAIANPAFEIHVVCGNTEANAGAFPSAGVSIWGTSATITGSTAVQKLELQRIVDSGMKWAQVFVTCLNSADGSGWVGTIDEVVCQPVGGSAFIADASILNAKIANLAVDDAKIATMSVGKLTAGTLISDVTVSARIKTANTGARVELNSSGFQAFNSSGVQTVDVAAASGAATFTGQFRTDFPTSVTPHIEMKNSGDRTTIYFTDNSGTGANYAFMNTPLDAGNIPRVGINSGIFTYLGVTDARMRLFLNTTAGIQLETTGSTGKLGFCLNMTDFFMSIQRTSSAANLTGGSFEASDVAFWLRRYGGGILNGGQVTSDTSNLWLEASASGTSAAMIHLQDNSAIYFRGRFAVDNSDGGNSALYCGVWNVVNISGGGTVNYGVTMATAPRVLFMINNGSGTSPGSHWVFAQGATSFEIRNSVNLNVNVTYWCIRVI
jgi:hypothetical protein